MRFEVILAVLLPFLGTTLGAATVLFPGKPGGPALRGCLNGFAAGVMTAASVWSLIIPALEQSGHLGPLAAVPALIGIWAGFLVLLLLDRLMPVLPLQPGPWRGNAMTVLAVALHNLPEGMAVGAVAAGWLAGSESIGAAAAFALALGIALQNLPEGAIVSMPLGAGGMGKWKAFGWGVLSGVIEPIGAALTILLTELTVPVLPYLLGFAAGAMLYVVATELIPEMDRGPRARSGTICFAGGFTLMMLLDVALG